MNIRLPILSILFLSLFVACKNSQKQEQKVKDAISSPESDKNNSVETLALSEITPINEDGDINVLVEIPAGTLEKWEVNKSTNQLELEHIDGKPRIVQYLGYPGNYGMVPGTLLPKEMGGDGDPMDVLVLGQPVQRGEVIKCKPIAVLNLIDRGEHDDKLIAVMEDSPLYSSNDLNDLKENYIGSLEIIELWFVNYKGPGKMISNGFQDKSKAELLLQKSIEAFEKRKN